MPVKRLSGAKTRLAPVLSPAERHLLVLAMLGDVLAAARQASTRVAVVSSDPDAAAEARRHGVEVISDDGLPWNEGLALAVSRLGSSEATAIVSADVPLVTAADVAALEARLPTRGVVVARALDAGTNAVALRPPDALVPNFGFPGSAAIHVERAHAAGLEAVLLDRPGLALDLDTASDLERFLETGAGGRSTRAALEDYRKRSSSAGRTRS